MESIAEGSPRFTARIAGLFYLLVFLTGGAALFVSGGLVVSGNAAATATNILAHEALFRLGFAMNLIATACYVVVTAPFYNLFKPVNRGLSLAAAFFSLVGCAIGGLSSGFSIAPLIVLKSAKYLSAFKTEQLQALAYMFLRLNIGNISLVFFGFFCLLIGCLIFKSTFLPRILGAGMVIAGLGWLTFLWPPLANYLSPYNLAPGILGEGLLTLWLLVMGVNVPRWKEQASTASTPS
jgi:hypothetical protein